MVLFWKGDIMNLNNKGTSDSSIDNKDNNSTKKKVIKIGASVLLLVAVLLVGLYLGGIFNRETADASGLKMGNGEEYDPGKYKDVKMSPTIDIPGFKEITFTANQLDQYAGFKNPENNTVHFKMTLALVDKNNREEVLWKSDLIEPGKACNKIKLNKKLSVGKHNARLKYEWHGYNT